MADMHKDTKLTAVGLQLLLTDVCGEERHISDILPRFGLTNDRVNLLKTKKIAEFYDNIKFVLTCQFFHYSGGHRLLLILFQHYGLFGYSKKTLEEIGSSIGISRERVRQLENKALKRLKGNTSSDSIGLFLVHAACKTLNIDAMDLLHSIEIKRNTGDHKATSALHKLPDLDLPHMEFYVLGKFNYETKRGSYQLLMTFGGYTKYFEQQGLEGRSDVSMILLAVIEGIEKLKKPCAITVYSNTVFGISSIYKGGKLREAVPENAANYELKEFVRQLLSEKGHVLENAADSNIRKRIKAWHDSNI